jgi:hypothetical protein
MAGDSPAHTCSYCGRANPDRLCACAECGTSLVNEPEQAGSTPIFGRLAEIISPAIKAWGMSRRSQVALLYFLACSCNALVISGFLSSLYKRGRPLFFDILTPCLLLLYLYLVLRFAAAEDEYIRKHPFRFYGSVLIGFFPWIAYVVLAVVGLLAHFCRF